MNDASFCLFFFIFNFYDYYFIIDTLDTSSHNAMRSKFALCGVCLFFFLQCHGQQSLERVCTQKVVSNQARI